jgi:hypothetical protein
MSGALVQLISRGVQDVYITNQESGTSLFRTKYTRQKNFSQSPKLIKKNLSSSDNTITVPTYGDLLDGIWLEGDDLLTKFDGARFDLYIGGTLVDSQTYDYMTGIWQNYLADTYTKSQEINNAVSSSNINFLPLHFFFCDNDMFLPLVALQYHPVEIKVTFENHAATNVRVCGSYIFLDTDEREYFVNNKLEFLITQVQRHAYTDPKIDLSYFNHPVKSIFFGFKAKERTLVNDKFTFDTADIILNGSPLVEDMTPVYFHTVQNYKYSKYGIIQYDEIEKAAFYTRYYVYHFCRNASTHTPNGTCNFSRLDNAELVIKNPVKGSSRTNEDIVVYALNYNVIRIQNGMAGILFGN